jgi:hypothetical protein
VGVSVPHFLLLEGGGAASGDRGVAVGWWSTPSSYVRRWHFPEPSLYLLGSAHEEGDGNGEYSGRFFWSLSFSFLGCMSGFPDALKIFLTDENGFFTYQIITSSSRIISRDKCTQCCPLECRGLDFLWKERLLVIFYLLLLTCLFSCIYTLKHQNHFAAIIVSVRACESISSTSRRFDNLFFIESYYNLTTYTCGLSCASNSIFYCSVSCSFLVSRSNVGGDVSLCDHA